MGSVSLRWTAVAAGLAGLLLSACAPQAAPSAPRTTSTAAIDDRPLQGWALSAGENGAETPGAAAWNAALDLASHAEAAAAGMDAGDTVQHDRAGRIGAGTLQRAVLAAWRLPELSLNTHAAFDRARQRANVIISVQASLNGTVGTTAPPQRYEETWQSIASLAREAARDLEGR